MQMASACLGLMGSERGNVAYPSATRAVDLLARCGLGEEEPLHLVAAGQPQQDALLLGSTPSISTLMQSARPSVTIAWMITPVLAD